MYSIEFCTGNVYELDHKPTAEDVEKFKECFLSDLLDGYLDIDSMVYPLEKED